MNYRLLLAKYIAHVGECEGATYLRGMDRDYSLTKGILFSDAEWEELERVADEDEPRGVAPDPPASL